MDELRKITRRRRNIKKEIKYHNRLLLDIQLYGKYLVVQRSHDEIRRYEQELKEVSQKEKQLKEQSK